MKTSFTLKVLFLPVLFSFLCGSLMSQTNQWTWVNGDSTVNQYGSYGTLGTAAASNKPGGRIGTVTWTDTNGNMWLFGGSGYASGSSGYLNDLWRYNTSSNEWTWVKGDNTAGQLGTYGTIGTAAATNKPGPRYSPVSWTDAAGNLWLFGGYEASTRGSGNLNDLWKYNITTGEWTWVNGGNTLDQPGIYGTMGTAAAANTPGGRYGAVTWTDANGNLWLFGGYSYYGATNGYFNDLWRYNTSTNEWTWVKGGNTVNQSGVYGTMGTAAASNTPGAKSGAATWTDASGKMWLFGGTTPSGYSNDLWAYNASTNEWTWVNGGNTVSQPGIYGTMGTPAAANIPGARYSSVSWTDATGSLWLFGGYTYTTAGSGDLNDLWKYNTTTNEWTWVNGANTVEQPSTYGTRGTAAAANRPGARYGAVGWSNAGGSMWLFGGYNYAGTIHGYFTDLWKYGPVTAAPTISSFTPTTAGTGATVTITGSNFTGATAVSFGGTTANSFTVINSTTITAVVGAGTSEDVNVTTPGGTATLAGFTYVAPPVITSFTPTTAGTGVTVTITGTDLTGATAVSFGGVPATSFTVVNSTTITAVVGAGTTGDVSVTTTGGTTTLAGFTYVAPPVITSFTPTTAGTGATVTMTGTDLTGATAVSFGGVPATSFTVVNSTTITAVVGAGTTGDVSVTTGGGTATLAGFSYCIAPAVPKVTIVQPSCLVPTGKIKVAIRSGFDYSIDRTTFVSTGTWPAVKDGLYTLTTRNTLTGCTRDTTLTVVRFAGSPGDYTTSGGGTICSYESGVPVTLDGSETGVSYLLLRNANSATTIAGNDLPLTFLNNKLAGVYTVKATNTSTGCWIKMSGSATVVVNTRPATPTGTNVTICRGTSTTISATAGGAGQTIRWYTAATGGTLLHTGFTYTTPVLTAVSKTYYAEAMNDVTSCVSVRKGITVVTNTCMVSRTIPQATDILMEATDGARISPNPARGSFNLQLKGYKAGKVLLQLCTANGTVIQTKAVEASAGVNQVPFDVQKEIKGMYLLRIVSAEKTETMRVVVM